MQDACQRAYETSSFSQQALQSTSLAPHPLTHSPTHSLQSQNHVHHIHHVHLSIYFSHLSLPLSHHVQPSQLFKSRLTSFFSSSAQLCSPYRLPHPRRNKTDVILRPIAIFTHQSFPAHPSPLPTIGFYLPNFTHTIAKFILMMEAVSSTVVHSYRYDLTIHVALSLPFNAHR